MVSNTGNRTSYQKLPGKSHISGKKMLVIEKEENKMLNTFQKLLE